jgi:CRP-like cAMP-binding protein
LLAVAPDPARELLGRVDLFSDLNARELQEFAGSLKQRRYEAGRAVVTEGESGVGFFVVAEGSASVSIEGEEVAMLGPGDCFGEIALLEESKRTATVTARSDLTCWGVPSWTFRPFVAAHPKLASRLRAQMDRLVGENH